MLDYSCVCIICDICDNVAGFFLILFYGSNKILRISKTFFVVAAAIAILFYYFTVFSLFNKISFIFSTSTKP